MVYRVFEVSTRRHGREEETRTIRVEFRIRIFCLWMWTFRQSDIDAFSLTQCGIGIAEMSYQEAAITARLWIADKPQWHRELHNYNLTSLKEERCNGKW